MFLNVVNYQMLFNLFVFPASSSSTYCRTTLFSVVLFRIFTVVVVLLFLLPLLLLSLFCGCCASENAASRDSFAVDLWVDVWLRPANTASYADCTSSEIPQRYYEFS
jgi:hypothetical protein